MNHQKSESNLERLRLGREKAKADKELREAGLLEPKEVRTDVPLKQIRKFCLECVGGSAPEVASCTGVNCPLWDLRFGKPLASAKKRHPDLMDRQKVLARFREAK